MDPNKYINVEVLEARNLISMDSNGLSDPFVVVSLNDDKKGARTTEVVKKSLNPVWTRNNAFSFRVHSPLTDVVRFVVWDYDKLSFNDFEGQVNVPVAAASSAKQESADLWLPLVNRKNKADRDRGTLHVRLTFIDPSAPAAAAAGVVAAPAPVAVVPPPAAPVAAASVVPLDWQIPFREVALNKELGRGASGIVYKGKWRLQDVAIKVIPSEKLGPKELGEFHAEIALMASVRPHRNLVTFLGVSMEPGSPLCLVTDFVDGGSLESKYMDPQFPIDWAFILKVAKGVCAGMHHLHEEGLLHRDLAARNILLTGSFEPVVADFGLSRKVDKLHQSKDNAVRETEFFRGPYKWMAPESLSQNVFSKKTDVWSFGVTMWEVMARSLPFNNLDIYTAADQIVNAGLRCPLSPQWPPRWQALLTACWNASPDLRPGFVEVSGMLDEIEREMVELASKN